MTGPTLRDWLTEASSLLVDVTPARELQAQLAALLAAEEPVTQHLLGIPLRVSRAVPPGQLRLDYRPDTAAELRAIAAYVRAPGHIPREDAIDACARLLENRARDLDAPGSPAAVHDDVPLDRDGLLSEEAPPLTYRPDTPGQCGAHDGHSPRVCTLPAGHEGAHHDARFDEAILSRVPDDEPAQPTQDCPHGHIPETCTACHDAQAMESLRQRMRDAEDRADRLQGELTAAHQRNKTLASLLEQVEVQRALAFDALRPFAHFARQWDAKPLRGQDDVVYGIHAGTEWAAELRLSDCRRAAAAVSGVLSDMSQLPQPPTALDGLLSYATTLHLAAGTRRVTLSQVAPDQWTTVRGTVNADGTVSALGPPSAPAPFDLAAMDAEGWLDEANLSS